MAPLGSKHEAHGSCIPAADDRPTFQQLIPQHLKDLACMPQPILEHLEAGGFGVVLTPSQWHAVALDECHEMKINKDAKLAVIHPNPQTYEASP